MTSPDPAPRKVMPRFSMRHRMMLALEYADVSVEAMAGYLGVHPNTVWGWAFGQHEPKRQTVVLWSMKCGVPMEWLETGTAPMTPGDIEARANRAQDVSRSLALSEIGHVNAMAEEEHLHFVAELRSDPVLLRIVLRQLAGAVATLAVAAVIAADDDDATSESEVHDRTVSIIRELIDSMVAQSSPEGD